MSVFLLEPKEIMKKIKVKLEIPEYDELFKGNVKKQLEIAKSIFRKYEN